MRRLLRLALLTCISAWLCSASAHFSVAPKIAIAPLPLPGPEVALLRTADLEVSRRDFSEHLQRLTAFATKYQRLQPDFAAYFNLMQGVAFFHPVNVHTYIDRIESVRDAGPVYGFAVRQWVKGQLEIYARLRSLLQSSGADRLARTPEVAAVLDFYAAGAKTALLEELVVLADMEPSLQGLRRFLDAHPAEAARLLETGFEEDTELTPPNEQRRLKDRWRRFRQDVLAATPYRDHCAAWDPSSSSDERVLLELDARRITQARYTAIFGAPSLGAGGAPQRRGNCSRMLLFYAMADLADSLGVSPPRLHQDIRVASQIYLMGRSLTHAYAQARPAGFANQRPLEITQTLMRHPKVVEVKDWLMRRAGLPALDAEETLLDEAFLAQTDWRLERVLAPKHSIHL